MIAIVSYQSLDKLIKNLNVVEFTFLKKEFPDKWQNLIKKISISISIFNNIIDYQKPVNNLEKEDFFSKLKSKCPDDDERERTEEDINLFGIKNGEEITEL